MALAGLGVEVRSVSRLSWSTRGGISAARSVGRWRAPAWELEEISGSSSVTSGCHGLHLGRLARTPARKEECRLHLDRVQKEKLEDFCLVFLHLQPPSQLQGSLPASLLVSCKVFPSGCCCFLGRQVG